MKLTKLQSNESIYRTMYFYVHDWVREICSKKDDSDHLLITRFNESQANSEEFKNALNELFYQSWSSFSWNYLRMTATDYYNKLEDKEAKNLFTEEFVEFLGLFE